MSKNPTKKPAPGRAGCLGCKYWNVNVCRAGHKEFIKQDECPYYMPIDDEEGPREIQTPGLTLDDGRIVEEVIQDGAPWFAVWDGDKVKYEAMIEANGTIYVPRWDDVVKKGFVKLPDASLISPRSKTNTAGLIDKLREHIKKYLDVSEDFLEFSIWYILLTWVYDRLSTVPYLRSLGDYGTGKSRFLDVVGGLCYRSINAGGATTAAAVARLIELWKGTLIYNEADWRQSDESQNMIKILNEGFEKRRGVIKANREDQGEMVVYEVFGPKLIATRKTWYDSALESRCITEVMRETMRDDIPPILTRQWEEEQEQLRAELLMFRFKNRDGVDEEEIEEVLPKFQVPLGKRLLQAAAVFAILFSHDERMMERFTKFIENYQEKLIAERADTFDGGIVNAIWELLDQETIAASDIAGTMTGRGFTNTKGGPVSPRTVGKHLRSLGFETKTVRIGDRTTRTILPNVGLLDKLFKRYTIDYDPERVTTVTFVTSVTNTQEPTQQEEDVSKGGGVFVTNETNATNVTGKIEDLEDPPQREKFDKVMEIIRELEEDHIDGAAPMKEIKRMAASEGIQAAFVEQMIAQERSRGHLYEPKQGMIQRAAG
jgi:hypothetical protein